MKSIIGIAAPAVAATAIFASAASAQMPKTVTIRHQMHGCHAWSYANGPYKASSSIRVARGTDLVFVDNDMMPHKLVQVAGPNAQLTKPKMNHMSARAFVSLTKKGVYRFTTKAGEDYPSMKGMKTIGEDNVLRLTIKVS